jgi:serine/threonine protein kinase
MTPTSLDNHRYRIIRTLGSGGFGDTFLAEDTQMPSKRWCVIKQLRPVNNNPKIYQLVQDRFQREAAILEELGEGNSQIPRLYAYFIEDGEFYLVQEWVEGETLGEKVIKSGRLSESSVQEILVNILPVLDYVHSRRIIHRDIKPDNIILRHRDNQPILIDFGAVKEAMGTMMTTGGNSTNSIVIGTPGYMPSEQSVGRPVFSSDLYSLGLTAIYLLTGKVPQELETDHNSGEIIWQHHALNVSSGFKAIIDKAIQSHPRDRYPTAKDMLNALRSGFAETFIPVSPPPGSSSNYAQQKTEPSLPIPNGTYPPPVSPQPIPSDKSLSDWQKAVIMGGVIGACVVGGLWITRPQSPEPTIQASSPPNPVSPSPVSPSPVSPSPVSPSPVSPSPVSPSPVSPSPVSPSPVSPSPVSPSPKPISKPQNVPPVPSISQAEAQKLVERWLEAKKRLFAPPYDRQLGATLTTGKAYSDNVQGPNSKGEESSSEWLQNNSSSYRYSVQRIDQIRRFEANGNFAVIELFVTEDKTFYNKNGNVDSKSSGIRKALFRYSLQMDNGVWKIADYHVVQ